VRRIENDGESKFFSHAGNATTFQLHAHGLGTSAKCLVSRSAEIGISSRPVNDAEIEALSAAHRIDIDASDNEHLLALDGLVVIVHPSNRVRQLTLDQVAQMFSSARFGAASAVATFRSSATAGRASLVSAPAFALCSSIVLRFDRGSANLDTRAQQDVARSARYLGTPAARGNRFLVPGFADNDGRWANNIRLSPDERRRPHAHGSRPASQSAMTRRCPSSISPRGMR
jgi:hypothetical protein